MISLYSGMLKVTDLRIDNWVIAPKIGICQVNGIQLHSDGNTYVFVVAEGMEFQHSVKLKDLKGVELTPEIFKQCGFTSNGKVPFSLGRFCIYSLGGGYLFEWAKKDNSFGHSATNFKYLHELQNIYSALHGEELPVKLALMES